MKKEQCDVDGLGTSFVSWYLFQLDRSMHVVQRINISLKQFTQLVSVNMI